MKKIGRCLKSALDTFTTRTTASNIDALSDIECDLQSALTSVRALIMSEMAERAVMLRSLTDGDHAAAATHANFRRIAKNKAAGR